MENQESKSEVLSSMETDYVQLPSQGLFYYGQFQGIKQLKVRKLNWEDEDILTTKAYYDNGTLFNELLKTCIVDEGGFPASILTTADKDAILFWLRIGEFGQEYKVPHTCPACKSQEKATWDLGSFSIPEYPTNVVEEITTEGMLIIELPVSKLKCAISPASIGRELEVDKKLKNKKEKLKQTKDFNITGRLLSIIKKAWDNEGVEHKGEDILNWLRTGFNGQPIPMIDSRYIRQRLKDIDLKIDTKQDIVCDNCGHLEEGVDMQTSIYFFWPEYSE